MDSATYQVLLVDENDADREHIRHLLPERFSLYEATAAREGLELFDTGKKPDCVLLDFRLSGETELNLLQFFVERGVAVVVLTGQGDDAVGIEAVKGGAQDYFIKRNLSEGALSRVIAYACERNELAQQNRDAVAALRESEQRFNDIAGRINYGLWIRDASTHRCTYVNSAFERIWGRSFEQMKSIRWTECVHPDDRQASHQAYMENAKAKTEYHHTYRIVQPNGEIRHVKNNGYPVLGEDGEVVRMAGIVRDVTDEMRFDEELRMAQKLEAIGQLAAGIAHEINTPSQYVSDNVSFLSDALEDLNPVLRAYKELLEVAGRSGVEEADLQRFRKLAEESDLEYLLEEIPDSLEQSRHGLTQIKNIVRAMKDFSHPGDEKEPVDLNHAIESIVTVARNEWKYAAEMELRLEQGLPAVVCIPSAMNQVFLNLIINAAHAIQDVIGDQNDQKGKITVSTRSDGDDVEVTVSDTGCGIPDEIRDKIFNPFFTTKGVGKGTGQGLAIAYTVIKERHGGTITIDSEPGKGTHFRIRLPRDGEGKDVEEQAA